nr:ribosome-inactivating protein [Tanacetum cinerariifolium]
QVAQTNPLEGPPIAPQADEPMPDPAHTPNVEEPIPSPVLEPVVQPVQAPSPIGSPSHLDIPSFGTTSTPQYIASTFDPLLSEAQFDAFTDFEAQQHHDQSTSGSLIYEHPPIPNPVTPPISTIERAAEATKKLNRDTVVLFYKRIKKLEAKVKTKSKKKLVITADSSQKEDISPSMVEAAQILTGDKLDPSKISKSPAAVAQKSVDSVATDSSIPAEEVVPADKGVSAASSNKGKGIAVESSVPQRKQTPQEIEQERLSMLEIDRLKAQDEKERKKRLADLSKSDFEYAKQVAQTMETSHAEPAPQVPATGPLPSIERQRNLDDMIASFSNTEYRAQQAKPMTRGDTVKFMRIYIKNMSAAYYSSGRTMEWANKFKGDDLIAEYNKIKPTVEGPSLGSTHADEVPADTGVSTDESVPADQRVPADQNVPADTSIPADDPDAAHTVDVTFASDDSDEDDTPHPIITGVHLLGWQVVPSGLGTIHTLLCYGGIRKTFTTLREILHMVDRQTLIRLYGFVDALSKKQPLNGLAPNQHKWRVRSGKLYNFPGVHVLELEDGTTLSTQCAVSDHSNGVRRSKDKLLLGLTSSVWTVSWPQISLEWLGNAWTCMKTNTIMGLPLFCFHTKNAKGNQLWTFKSDGTIRSNGKCLTANCYASGDYIWIFNCDKAKPKATKWVLYNAGTIMNPRSGLVIAAESSTQRTVLNVAEDNNFSRQAWCANTQPTINYISGFRKMCLQANGSYARVWLANCVIGTEPRQQWALYGDSNIRLYSDHTLCMTSNGHESSDSIFLLKG